MPGAFVEVGPRDRRGNLGDGISSGGLRARNQRTRRDAGRGEQVPIGDHALLRREPGRWIGGGASAAGERDIGTAQGIAVVDPYPAGQGALWLPSNVLAWYGTLKPRISGSTLHASRVANVDGPIPDRLAS